MLLAMRTEKLFLFVCCKNADSLFIQPRKLYAFLFKDIALLSVKRQLSRSLAAAEPPFYLGILL